MSGIYFVGALRRRPDLSIAAFGEHFRTTHRAYIEPFGEPGYLQGYVQNIRVEQDPEGIVSDLDGAPELWIRDGEALGIMAATPEFQEANLVDSPRFIDMPPRAGLMQRDIVLDATPRSQLGGAIKLMLFFEAGDVAKATEAWSAKAPILMPAATPLRLERALALPGEDGATPFFGCESSWWPDEQALSAAWQGRIDDDARTALGFAGLSILVASEAVSIALQD